MKHYVKSYEDFLNEDIGGGGVAYATNGGMTGMGAVISPGGNTCPGVPGDAGSGDFGAPFLPTAKLKNTIYKPAAPTSNKKSKKKEQIISTVKTLSKSKKTPATKTKSMEPTAVKSFSDFIRDFE